MRRKDASVNLADLTTAMAEALTVIEGAYNSTLEMVVTSGKDGQHSEASKHYVGDAVDIRTHHLTGAAQGKLLLAVREALGPEFVAIIEDIGGPNNHLHVQRGHRERS